MARRLSLSCTERNAHVETPFWFHNASAVQYSECTWITKAQPPEFLGRFGSDEEEWYELNFVNARRGTAIGGCGCERCHGHIGRNEKAKSRSHSEVENY